MHGHLNVKFEGTFHLQNKSPPNPRQISTRLYSITPQKTAFYKLHPFQICALGNIYGYVANHQMHIDKTCCITY